MANAIHPRAAIGFERAGADYERGRPGYPDDAVRAMAAQLGIAPGCTVVDLAAGTGKLTRSLTGFGARLIAVEPVAAMREQLERALPDVEALEGTAERIPLPDGCADAVVVAQAFHWFHVAGAAAEIHRVLRPDGGLGVIWNSWDETVRWVERMQSLVHEHAGGTPRQDTSPWSERLAATELFTEPEQRKFPNVVYGDLDTLLARMASVSYISALPETERARVLEAVAEVVAQDPETAGREPIAMPYTTHVCCCRRRAGPSV